MGLELRLATRTAALSPLERLSELWQTLALRVVDCADEHEPRYLLDERNQPNAGRERGKSVWYIWANKVRYMYMNGPNRRRNITCDESYTTQHLLTRLWEAL